MAAKLSVIVKPATALGSPASVKQSLFARLKYRREIPSEDDAAGAPQTIAIDGSRREELDTLGTAKLSVEDHANGTPFTVQIETAQGTGLWQSPETAPPGGGAAAEFAIPDSVFDAAQRRTPTASPTLLRAGRFVTLDDTFPDFSGYRLFIAAVRPATIDGSANPQTGAVRKILGLAGGGEVTSFEVKRLDPKKLEPAAVNALGFQSATIRADGAFDVSIDIIGDEIAWVWLLIGPESFVGYQLDAVPTEPRPAAVILLPFVPARPSETGSASPDTDGDGASVPAAGPHGTVPMEYDERQLVDHPSTFSDDPGKFCTPFENPQRILGERRFFTVLRIDQPEIGGQGSLKISRPIVLDLAPPIRMTAVATAISARREDAVTGAVTPALTNLNLARLNLASGSQPRLDFRSVLNTDVFRPSRKPWIRWVRERSKDRKPVSADNPIEWDGDPTIYQAATVAGGHVLEWRVQWRSNGYSLGNVAHTLTLAPRQTRRIAKVSWRRRETAVRRERTEAADALTQVTTRARDYTDAVQSSLSEWSSGGSKSRTTGAAGGIGFAMGPVVIGGGAAHGQASSSSWQQGGRRVAAAEQQQLRDAIRQYGESVRSLESTVVTEIAQEEEAEGVSETLRNINYCHALSVLYYEILRHLRVDTSFAGLRECLFVPFSVTPFDIDKALKWRDKLRHGMLDESLRWALDRLDEVASAWADSDIPPGRRMHHPVNFLSGSVYVQLSVDRPRDQGKEEALEDYYAVWRPFSPILAVPARRIIEALQRDERARDQYFQREVAPMMAARWANQLEIAIGGNPISNVDFTLASAYRFGDTVRIDFTASINGALNREQMQQITARSKQALPAGSVANLKRMSLHYFTDHFDREIQSDQGARDLIAVDTGLPDAGAVAHFALSAWERENLREVIENAVEKLIVHLNANLVYYHKVVWWLMDRDELYMMLDGFTAPYGRRFENGVWVEDPGRSLASVVERDPMAILGNSLVFRVAAGAFLGIDGHESPDAAHRYYYDSQVRTEPLRVSLPTEGLYAQALMDKCMACEEHQGNTDWVLTDQDPELELLADQLGSRRAAPESLTPTKLPDTIISLQNAPNAPDPSGLAGVLGAVTNAGAFRDMAGLAGTQANAAAAMQTAASLATNFGNQAANLELERRKLAASELDKQRASLQRAVDAKVLPPEDATKHLNALYKQATGAASSEAPTRSTDELATNVAAGLRPGQSGTVSRVTPSGAETVSIDSSKLLASTNFSEIRTQCGFPGAGRVVSESDLRDFIRLRAEGERTAWIDPATNQIFGEDADEMFGRLVAMWLSVHGAIPPDALPTLQSNAADPATNYGQILVQNVATAVLNTEIARVRGDILANVPLAHTPSNLDALIDEAIRRARLSRHDDPNFAFWSAAFVSFCVRNAAIDAGVEGMEQDTHSGRDELLVTAISHLTFLQNAFRRRFGPTGQTKGTYHAFRPDEREPQVGDIIVQDRTANSINNVLAFQNIPNVANRGLHSDIVVEANPGNDFVVCIGGNIGDSTRQRRFPLDANRRLIVQRQQLFTQEDASQNLPNIPAAGNAAGLPDFSTGRVFALMSPVEICIVIPGTRINGDVVT